MLSPDQLRFSDEAWQDLKGIWNHTTHEWNAAQAEAYIGELYRVCYSILEHPKLRRAMVDVHPNLRMVPHKQHHVFYRLNSRGIIFVAFLHNRMDALAHLTDRLGA